MRDLPTMFVDARYSALSDAVSAACYGERTRHGPFRNSYRPATGTPFAVPKLRPGSFYGS